MPGLGAFLLERMTAANHIEKHFNVTPVMWSPNIYADVSPGKQLGQLITGYRSEAIETMNRENAEAKRLIANGFFKRINDDDRRQAMKAVAEMDKKMDKRWRTYRKVKYGMTDEEIDKDGVYRRTK